MTESTAPENTPEKQPVSSPPAVLPPHYFGLALLIMLVTGFLDGSRVLTGYWNFIGILPILIGVLLAAQGSRLFARAGTSIIPFSRSTALVVSGVFAHSRNPMYTGMVLALIGTAVLLNGWLSWLVLPPFVAIIRYFFIANEERLMEATFGEDYLAYKATVRRWL